MALHETLLQFHEKFGPLEKDAFLSKFGSPFLVVELDPKDQSTDSKFKTLDQPGERERSTTQVKRKAGPHDVREFLAIPLVKSDRNSFGNMITVGRSSNNDVVVPHASVSKLHAIFKVDGPTQTVSVSDVGSSYGTTVNGKGLEKNVDRDLKSGDSVRFADSVKATVLAKEDFFEYLHLYIRMPG
ncbi:MAG: FHA domain-containing protein [Planctomycetota bacterium]|jgi:pSer/pThr/pTyr-binding forkhead associated (FHA) protein